MIAPNGTVVEGPAASEQLQSQAVTGKKKRIPRAGERALDTAGNVIGDVVTKVERIAPQAHAAAPVQRHPHVP